MPDWNEISTKLGVPNAIPTPVSGGDISAAWRLGNLFLKTGPLASRDMFSAEAGGLDEIANSNSVRVPEVVGLGETGDSAYIAIEWIEFERPTADTEFMLGRQLAEMHRCTAERFGWHRDNTIGLTPQPNTWTDDWVVFLREQRIGYQLRLAADKGFTGELQAQGEQLLKRLPIWFENVEIVPSLLHGDLWSGNWGAAGGYPVVFDPAVYYGDRESDLAMTRLFGGFGKEFYRSYESVWPLQHGHLERCRVYQLYHVLNHLNLFGSAYLGRALQLMDDLL